jgi:hypothetical protein
MEWGGWGGWGAPGTKIRILELFASMDF